ncbi:DUF4190 domain-containing protein [Streptomyces sp. NL15-2K]|uniref:DUF4190 domain-containing protein n=1 Tax=Streptomyces sp. NL15-2K TaxID=376149 RepID=UPI000F5860F8|nr:MULTISPECIES: DUF4190 domain-containing protein [Actinomycetes]WKX13003.1 DUF4190 domain-containing protein [Kutzneria buriramensis]GCB45676.1 hypothetical protein SNL152K_2967 [Streptomyces sp. NL15-2K]
MSDDAQTPEDVAAHRPTPPGRSDRPGESDGASRDPWAAPADRGPEDAAPQVDLGKQGQQSQGVTPPGGPGATLADTGPITRPSTPPASSVHDQQTVTSMPGVGTPHPHSVDSQAWASPFAQPTPSAPANGSVNPFAPPNPAAPPNTGPASPFAAPAQGGLHPQGLPVPPPPISPDGPGQVPYGYPGGYGYPTPPGYGAHGPQSQGSGAYYGWPGMAPGPSNGMGTAALVLGIIGAVGFCLWPLAIVAGILAVVFGTIGRGKARRGEATNPGQALAGIICGSVGLVLGIGMILLLVFVP